MNQRFAVGWDGVRREALGREGKRKGRTNSTLERVVGREDGVHEGTDLGEEHKVSLPSNKNPCRIQLDATNLVERDVDGDLGRVGDAVRVCQELVGPNPLLDAPDATALADCVHALASVALELAEFRRALGGEGLKAGREVVDGRGGGGARRDVGRDGAGQFALDGVVRLGPGGGGVRSGVARLRGEGNGSAPWSGGGMTSERCGSCRKVARGGGGRKRTDLDGRLRFCMAVASLRVRDGVSSMLSLSSSLSFLELVVASFTPRSVL